MEKVVDVPERSRFELHVGGRRVGVLDYNVEGGSVTLPHTEVDPACGGRGLGQALVQGALDAFRERGVTVRPVCSFVRHYIDKHPEYHDLVVKEG